MPHTHAQSECVTIVWGKCLGSQRHRWPRIKLPSRCSIMHSNLQRVYMPLGRMRRWMANMSSSFFQSNGL